MKKIIFAIALIMMASQAFAYEYFYAPRTIKCNKNICKGMDRPISPGFRINPRTPPIDGVYSFYQAEFAPSEIYYRQDIDPRAPRIEYFGNSYYPATFLPNSKWYTASQGGQWCTTSDSLFCPFYQH